MKQTTMMLFAEQQSTSLIDIKDLKGSVISSHN